MSDDIVEGTDVSLKGKDFDEACTLLVDEKNVRGVVHKKPTDGGRWAHCFSFGADEYSEAELLDTIVSEYGPGDYPVQFKSPGKGGGQVIRWYRQMTVQQKRHRAPTAAPASSSGDGNAMLAAAIENNSRILASLVEKITATPAAPAQKDTLEIAKDLAGLKELFSTDKSSPLDAIKEVLEVMALLQNQSGAGDDPMTLALKTLLPAIAKGTEELRQREVTRPGAKIAAELAAPAAAPGAESQAPKPEPVVIDQRAQVQTEAAHIEAAYSYFAQNFLSNALGLAKVGRNPQDVAEYLNRYVDGQPAMIDIVGRVIAEDNMIERLAAVNPEVLTWSGWLDELADWLAHALWPDTNPAPAADNATNDATIVDDQAPDGIKTVETNGIDDDDPEVPLGADGKPINDANADTSDTVRNDDT